MTCAEFAAHACAGPERDDDLPGPHGCPCPHEGGYGQQTGRSFSRLPSSIGGVRHRRTGERRWLNVTAVPDAQDDRGRPSWAYAIMTDLTEGRLRDANVLGVIVVDERRVFEANDAYLAMIGHNRDDLEAGRVR